MSSAGTTGTWSMLAGTASRRAKPNTSHRFLQMTDAQRDAEVAKYDREMPGTPGRPLSPQGKAEHAKARRKARLGRPPIGKGAKRVLITVERGLLKRADSFARQHGMNRSELIAAALNTVIGSAA